MASKNNEIQYAIKLTVTAVSIERDVSIGPQVLTCRENSSRDDVDDEFFCVTVDQQKAMSSQPAITCLKLTIETLTKCEYVQI